MNNLISDNVAENYGGGIYAREDTSLYINNTITNNSSKIGSGMYVKESSPILINNIIAHSESLLSSVDNKLTQSGNTLIVYRYSGGVLAGATITAAFVNNGVASDVKVQVTGIDKDTVVAAAPYEQFSLVIACGIGGYSRVNTEISSATDTLIISASSPEVKLRPSGFSVKSMGLKEVPGIGLIASECDEIVLKNCLFYGNEGG